MSKELDLLGKELIMQLSNLHNYSRDLSLGTNDLIQSFPDDEEIFQASHFFELEKKIFSLDFYKDLDNTISEDQISDESSESNSEENIPFREKNKIKEQQSDVTGRQNADVIDTEKDPKYSSGKPFEFNTQNKAENSSTYSESAGSEKRTKIGSFSDFLNKVADKETIEDSNLQVSNLPYSSAENLFNNNQKVAVRQTSEINSEIRNQILQLKKITESSGDKDIVQLSSIVATLLSDLSEKSRSENTANQNSALESKNSAIDFIPLLNKENKTAVSEKVEQSAGSFAEQKSKYLKELDQIARTTADSNLNTLTKILRSILTGNLEQKSRSNFNESGFRENNNKSITPDIIHSNATVHKPDLNFSESQSQLKSEQTFFSGEKTKNSILRSVEVSNAEIKNDTILSDKIFEIRKDKSTQNITRDQFSASDNTPSIAYTEPIAEKIKPARSVAKIDDSAYKFNKELRLNFQRYFSE